MLVKLKNGYDTLIKHVAQHIPIYLNHPVSVINYEKSPIKIICQLRSFYCDKIIITLPIGVLKKGDCRFYPNLPKTKRVAIQAIGSGLLNKIVMKFPFCFWEKDVLSLRLLKGGNNPMPICVNYQAIMGVPILISLHGGKMAHKLESMSKETLFQFAVDPLKKIYGSHFIEPSEVITTCWQKDIYSKGAYSYLPYGIKHQCLTTLAQPLEGRLFFAGEATSSKDYATVHGAYDTGIRAAKQVEEMIK